MQLYRSLQELILTPCQSTHSYLYDTSRLHSHAHCSTAIQEPSFFTPKLILEGSGPHMCSPRRWCTCLWQRWAAGAARLLQKQAQEPDPVLSHLVAAHMLASAEPTHLFARLLPKPYDARKHLPGYMTSGRLLNLWNAHSTSTQKAHQILPASCAN